MVDVLGKVRTYRLSKNKVANKVAITQMSSQQVVTLVSKPVIINCVTLTLIQAP